MFDALLSATSGAVAAAVSRALTEIFETYRSRRRTLDDIRVELGHSKISMPEHETAATLAVGILEEIEATKGKALSALTDREVRQISRSLSRILEAKAAKEPLYDKKAGTQILEELRAEYPPIAAAQ
jgi:hypothetical protein